MRVGAARVSVVVLVLASGCSKSSEPGLTPRPDAGDTGIGAPAPDAGVPFVELAGVVHVHSPFSHDACDGEGLQDGQPDSACLSQLRKALCETELDFAMLTDHPSYMSEYPFEDLLLFQPGTDRAVRDPSGAMIANEMGCTGGRRVLLTVGYEGSPHAMPLGLHRHVAPEHYSGIDLARGTDHARELVTALEDAGAVSAMAHSEQDDVSAELIVDSGLDAMEWYNVHASIKSLLGSDEVIGSAAQVLDLLGRLRDFANPASNAHPDLLFLGLRDNWPQAGFDKWEAVLRARPITGLLGSDVHRNVSIAPICDQSDPLELAACVLAAEEILPEYLHSLIAGGTLVMPDGDRFDSYARILRWLSNRVWAKDASMGEIQDALRSGRGYGVFTVFGASPGFSVLGETATGATVWPGDAASNLSKVRVEVPRPRQLTHGAPFGDAEAALAERRLVIKRIDAGGTEVIFDGPVADEAITVPTNGNGAYVAEVWIRPLHLAAALGTQSELATDEYLWIIANPMWRRSSND